MHSPDPSEASASPANSFTAGDVSAILREHGWLSADPTPEQISWCEHAAAILSGHAADGAALASCSGWFFITMHGIISKVESHVVLSRYAARGVLRELHCCFWMARAVKFREIQRIITRLKEGLDLRGRELFHPIRLALAGRAGEGELDRVILLLDEAAGLSFAVAVKSCERESWSFGAALD